MVQKQRLWYSVLTVLILSICSDFWSIDAQQLGFSEMHHVLIEGDTCYDQTRRVNGICRTQSNCPEMIKDLNERGILPQKCFHRGFTAIWCCPLENTPSSTRPYREQEHTTTPRSYSNRATGDSAGFSRTSEQKCHDYSNLTLSKSVVGSFGLYPSKNTVDEHKCKYNGGEGFIVGGTPARPGGDYVFRHTQQKKNPCHENKT